MTLTVSISELRGNISRYLDRVMQGTRVFIRDEKRELTIAQITQVHAFDKDLYTKTLHKAAGVLTAKNHPEWSNLEKVTRWVGKNRLGSERSF